MALAPIGFVDLPPFRESGFDHGDVHLATRRIFVAHTADGTIEVIDGDSLVHAGTSPGCSEASGVLCVQDEGLVFAAARGAGKVLVIDAGSLSVMSEPTTGPRPNGLAWNARAGTLLVADIEDFGAAAVCQQLRARRQGRPSRTAALVRLRPCRGPVPRQHP